MLVVQLIHDNYQPLINIKGVNNIMNNDGVERNYDHDRMSDCHQAPVYIVGHTTLHYECSRCGKACNTVLKSEQTQ